MHIFCEVADEGRGTTETITALRYCREATIVVEGRGAWKGGGKSIDGEMRDTQNWRQTLLYLQTLFPVETQSDIAECTRLCQVQ